MLEMLQTPVHNQTEFLQVQQAENKENHKFMEALLQQMAQTNTHILPLGSTANHQPS